MPWGAPDPCTAYVGTCDAGQCGEPTAAVVRLDDETWLSLCWFHALTELAPTETNAEPGD